MDTGAKNVIIDFSSNRDIFDDESGRILTKTEVNDMIRNICFEELGLTSKSTDKQIRRALKSEKANEVFASVEEVVEVRTSAMIANDEFFAQFVDTKNPNDGDTNEFTPDRDTLLVVSKVSGDHHDLVMQRLSEETPVSIPTSWLAVKVGTDLRLFLTGKKDWNKFIDALAFAFVNKIKTLIAAEFAGGTNLIGAPAPLTGTGTLGAATKANFDAIIEKVEAANGSAVVLVGTKTALKNCNALATVNWAQPANSVAEAVAATGIIGNYEGTDMLVIPQKFTDATLATPVVPNNKIFILPLVDNKFIKMVDYGEVILEKTDAGDTVDDLQSYEAQRRMGVGTILSRQIGIWTI